MAALSFCATETALPRMTDIARELGFTTGAATGAIDSLEKKGLVNRVRSQEDRRTIGVAVTDKGRKALNDIFGEEKA